MKDLGYTTIKYKEFSALIFPNARIEILQNGHKLNSFWGRTFNDNLKRIARELLIDEYVNRRQHEGADKLDNPGRPRFEARNEFLESKENKKLEKEKQKLLKMDFNLFIENHEKIKRFKPRLHKKSVSRY